MITKIRKHCIAVSKKTDRVFKHLKWVYRKFYLLDTKISSRSSSAATCKTVLPVAIVNGYKPLTIAIKNFISHIAALPDPSIRSIYRRYLLPMNFSHRMRPHENTCNDVHSENPATNQKT